MKKSIVKLGAFAISAVLTSAMLCSCASPTRVDAISVIPSERALQESRRQYRDAELIVNGRCTGNHTDSNGAICADYEITEVLAGSAKVGDSIHCPNSSAEVGESYLLYLSVGEDVFYSEDLISYSSNSQPLHITNDMVDWAGTKVDFKALKNDMKQLNSVITIPAASYFHSSLNQLVLNTDNIFIGKVTAMPELTSTKTRSSDSGVSIENSYDASIVTVKAFGSIKGHVNYGQEISLVYTKDMMSELIDSETLEVKDYESSHATPLKEGSTYLFFVNAGPDAKQEFYFPVNPIQGFAYLNGDKITVSTYNTALNGFDSLTPLVKRMQLVMKNIPKQSPILVIDG